MALLAHTDAVKVIMASALKTEIGTASEVRFYTANDYATELAVVPMPSAWTDGASGVINAADFTDDTTAVAGTAAFARIHKSNGTVLMYCDVGTTVSESITLSSVIFATNDTVTLTALSWTGPQDSAGLGTIV